MDINSFREVIKQREETDNEWDYGIEQCWKKEIEILSEDIPSTIEFLKNECTADEYSWISEVIDAVVDKVPSKELVQCYTELMAKFPEECQKYNIKEYVPHFAKKPACADKTVTQLLFMTMSYFLLKQPFLMENLKSHISMLQTKLLFQMVWFLSQ